MKKFLNVAFIAGFVIAFVLADGPELHVTWANNLAAWREFWRFGLS